MRNPNSLKTDSLITEAQSIVRSNYDLAAKIRQMLDESNLQENRRVAELIVEIQSLALNITNNPPLDSVWILEAEPELNLFMDRPLHSLKESPSPSFSLELDNLPEIDLEQNLNEIYRQVYINDEANLRDRIQQALKTRTEITLAQLIELYPITQGLAEIVAYLAIAEKETQHYISETNLEHIKIDGVELDGKLSLTIPQIIFTRSP